MTKRHFEAVASVLAAELGIRKDNPAARDAVRCIALSMADIFKSDNPRFDRRRFLSACGLTAEDAPTTFAADA